MLTLIPLLAATLSAMPDTTPAAPPTGDVLVVANQGDATVHLVEIATGRTLAVVPSAPAPHEVAVTRDGRWAVATNYGNREAVGHALTVVDVSTQTAVRSLDLAPHTRPHGIAFLPGDSLLAVTSETSRAVLLVAFPGGELRAVLPTNQAGTHILAIAPGGGKVWTANVGSGTLTELDVRTKSPTRTIQVGPGTEGAALTPDGRRIWAASMGLDSTYVFDTATGARVAAIATPGHAYRVAVSPDGRRAVIPAPELDLVRVIDTATMRETTIPVAGTPGGAVFSADGRTAYVPVMRTGQVAVVDLHFNAVSRMLPTGAAPDGMAISTFFRR
ncbi:MAG TPA: YncE family protein [Longimicrobium sp.]